MVSIGHVRVMIKVSTGVKGMNVLNGGCSNGQKCNNVCSCHEENEVNNRLQGNADKEKSIKGHVG